MIRARWAPGSVQFARVCRESDRWRQCTQATAGDHSGRIVAGMTDGPSHRRYARLVYDFEIELTDVMAARAHTMDRTKGEDGEVLLGSQPSDEEQILASINQVISTTAAMNRDKGFRWVGGSLRTRPLNEDGSYPSFVLPALPGRRDDGTVVDPPR